MKSGKLKWFDSTKGFGFIIQDEDGSDLFLHVTDLVKANIEELNDGEIIHYEVGEFNGKNKAINLSK